MTTNEMSLAREYGKHLMLSDYELDVILENCTSEEYRSGKVFNLLNKKREELDARWQRLDMEE